VKIVRMTSLGVRRTFSPEMASPHHNYVTEHSGAVHKNSHAVAYCLVAHRCLWLKARYPAEWWAAVMSSCHPDKLVRYMGVAKSEKVRFSSLNIGNLSVNFSVTGDEINPGLIGVKKIGRAAARQFEGTGQYTCVDDFVRRHPKNRIVLERLIKLGSFTHLHPNRKATWNWYLYKYGVGKGMGEHRRDVRLALLRKEGWTPERTAAEYQRLIEDFRAMYPRRTVIPPKLLQWKPKPKDDRDAVMDLYEEDFTTAEILNFEKEFLGYYLSNPLDRFVSLPGATLQNVAEAVADRRCGVVNAVVMGLEFSLTKKGDKMCRLRLYDGATESLLLLWSDECESYGKLLAQCEEALTREVRQKDAPAGPKKVELAVGAKVKYAAERKSFTLQRGTRCLWLLERKDVLT